MNSSSPRLHEADTESSPNVLDTLRRDKSSRRAFLARMGAAGLGMAAISLLDGCSGGSSGGGNNNGGLGKFPLALPGRNSTQKTLNYALTLELLEADLYRQALNIASGRPVATALDSSPSSYTNAVGGGGLSGDFTTAGFAYIRDFAFVEAAHVEFLQAALSGAPTVTRNPNGYQFPTTPASTIRDLLAALLPLEETGVRAYLGAAGYIGDLAKVQAAVAIYSTEARHSSAINYILGNDPGPTPMAGDQQVTPSYPHPNTFEYFLTPQTVVTAIQPFLVP